MQHALAPIQTDVDDSGRLRDRVAMAYPARLLVVDDHEQPTVVTAHLVNLSERGAALRAYGKLEPGSIALLVIDAGHAPIQVSVRVVWNRTLHYGGPRVGVTFDEQLTVDQRDAIDELLAKHDT